MLRVGCFISTILLLGYPVPCEGQEAAPSLPTATLKGLRARPSIELSVSRSKSVVTAPIDIQIFITNLTERDFVVQEVRLLLPTDLGAARKDDVSGLQRTLTSQHLRPGHQRIESFNLPDVFSWRSNLPRLTFLPGSYEIGAVVVYRVMPEEGTSEASASATMNVDSGLESLLLGGVLGALLLGAFMGAYELNKSGFGGWKKIVGNVLRTALAGAVCAAVVILMLKRLQGLELPISLVVTDFYGGIVVGLFSYKLGDKLFDMFAGS